MPEPFGSPIQPQAPQKKAGKIFTLVVGVVFLCVIGFGALVSYYIWQIKYGDPQTVTKTFQSDISLYEGLSRTSTDVSAEQVQATIRSHSPTAGTPDAAVTVIAFIDFECPFCQAEYQTFKGVMDTYGPAARFVFKHFPIQSIHPDSFQASLAAACASEQKNFWSYYDLLFVNKQFDQASLISYAKTLKLDIAKFTTCLDTKKYTSAVETDLQDGVDLGVRGTPTYFVNGIKIEGAADRAVWDQVILKELKK